MADVEVRRDAPPARWSPLAELDRMRREMDELWSGLGATGWSEAGAAFIPPADVEDREDAWVVEVELPGVTKKDVEIEIADRTLVVRGERKEKERKGILRHKKRVTGTFRYEITVPGDIDEESVSASLTDGELTVELPKAATGRARRIEIS
jgi:HSP20 family protein